MTSTMREAIDFWLDKVFLKDSKISFKYSPVPFESTVGTPKIRRLTGTYFPFVDSKGTGLYEEEI